MLLVKTYLMSSNIHGIGLFSDQDIKKGEKIYQVDGFTLRFDENEYQHYLKLNKDFVLKYFWKSGNLYFCSLDNDRFMNHSDNPNTIKTEDATYAKIDIKKGEEITCNYNDFCELGLNW